MLLGVVLSVIFLGLVGLVGVLTASAIPSALQAWASVAYGLVLTGLFLSAGAILISGQVPEPLQHAVSGLTMLGGLTFTGAIIRWSREGGRS